MVQLNYLMLKGKAVATSIYPLEMGEIYTQFGCEAGKEIVRKSFLTPVAPQQKQQQQPPQQQQQSTSKVREEQAKNVPDVAVAGTSEVSAGDLKDAIAMFTDHLTADNESETKETIQRQLLKLQEFISLSQLQHPLSNLQTNFNQSDWLKMQSVGQMSANEAFGQMAQPSRHQQLEQTSTFNKAPPRYNYSFLLLQIRNDEIHVIKSNLCPSTIFLYLKVRKFIFMCDHYAHANIKTSYQKR